MTCMHVYMVYTGDASACVGHLVASRSHRRPDAHLPAELHRARVHLPFQAGTLSADAYLSPQLQIDLCLSICLCIYMDAHLPAELHRARIHLPHQAGRVCGDARRASHGRQRSPGTGPALRGLYHERARLAHDRRYNTPRVRPL